MLGALLAAGVVTKIESQYLREGTAFAGVALIGYAVFLFSWTTPFPGWAALVPCVGAALLIYSGDDSRSTVARVLSVRPVVFVGLISYSLYLWHWPLLVFAQYRNVELLSGAEVAAIIILSFVLASCSWIFVEQPFRRGGASLLSRQPLFGAAVMATVLAVSFGLVGIASQGWPERISPSILRVANGAGFTDERLKDCLERPAIEACDFGAPVKAKYAVWGDSHGAAVTAALGRLAGQHGEAVKAFVHLAVRRSSP